MAPKKKVEVVEVVEVEDDASSTNRNDGMPSWSVRRKIILTTLLYCGLAVTYVIVAGVDTRVYETVVMSSFGLAGMVIGSYVFGAVWDDRSRREMSTARPKVVIASRSPARRRK